MSVGSELYKVVYNGLGSTGPYPITFPVTLDQGGNAQDIVIKLVDPSGAETDISSLCLVSGTNVYTGSSYAATYLVVIIRYPSITQPYTFPFRTKFPSRDFENALDRLCFAVQRLSLQSDQSLKAALSDAEPGRLPSKASLANYLLGFDSAGDPIAAVGGNAVSAAMAPVVSSASLALALSALGFSTFIQTLINDADQAAAQVTLGTVLQGYIGVSLTHFTDTAEPSIASGSRVEIGGTLYSFGSDMAGTGWAGIGNNNVVYMYLVPSGASVSCAYSTTVPAWDSAKQGWYNGNDRACAVMFKNSGGLYTAKALTPGAPMNTTVRRIIWGPGTGTYYWVCPLDVTTIRVNAVGQGGSGANGGNSSYGGGGGGSGAYCRDVDISVTPGALYTIVLSSSAASTITGTGVSLSLGKGSNASTSTGGGGGSGSGGATNGYAGGNGQGSTPWPSGGGGGIGGVGGTGLSTPGGGGGSGGPGSANVGGIRSSHPYLNGEGGSGAASPGVGWGAGSSGAATANGVVGGIGGGGSGGGGNGSSYTGAAGGNPVIVIEW